jgi:hypothetical protein
MRIICDQCDQPISGTVKRVSGNFNLHPHCLPEFTEELNTYFPSTYRRQEFALVWLGKWKQESLVSTREFVKS